MKVATMTRPTKDMINTSVHLLALLQGDEALRALVQTTVPEVLEACRPDLGERACSRRRTPCDSSAARRSTHDGREQARSRRETDKEKARRFGRA
jgi:hypothetical protein